MFKLVVLGLLLSAIAINGRPNKDPGSAMNAAQEARRMVHRANWAAAGTISTYPSFEGFPMVNIVPTADSKDGDIVFYMMDRDITAMDTKQDNKITLLFSDAQEGECNKKNVDPWSHLCPRVMITGSVKKMEKDTDEYTRDLEAFYKSHPTAVSWKAPSIPGHEFYLCKLDISNVLVFGQAGYKSATREEYIAGTDAVDA